MTAWKSLAALVAFADCKQRGHGVAISFELILEGLAIRVSRKQIKGLTRRDGVVLSFAALDADPNAGQKAIANAIARLS